MRELASNLLINMLSDLLLLALASILFLILAQLARNSRRSKLVRFFQLNPTQPEITIYLSRHQSTATLPRISIPSISSESTDAIKRLKVLEDEESQRLPEESQLQSKSFTTVSAIEMIEALRLRDELRTSVFHDWLPKEIQEELRRHQIAGEQIKVKIEVCPDPTDYKALIKDGTMIFIGGPRANLGAYFYLYGEKAGKLRPKRLTSEKNRVEFIDSDKNPITCPPERNLSIIQRSTIGSRTLVYLAGTGVNGTAGAVAYLRKNWYKLHTRYEQSDFGIAIECLGREKDDISGYISMDWIGTEWAVRAECDHDNDNSF